MADRILEGTSIRDLSGESLYEFLFNKLPCVYSFENINLNKAIKHLYESKSTSVVTQHIAHPAEKPKHSKDSQSLKHRFSDGMSFFIQDENESSSNVFFFRRDDLLIRVSHYGKNAYLNLYGPNIDCINNAVAEFSDFINPLVENSEIGLLVSVHGSIAIKKIPLDVKDLDVKSNYGSSFADKKHDVIVDKLKNERSGLYIFHGPAGTGKTNYIKYLSRLIDRSFVFVPTNMIDALVTPNMVQTLIDHENLVLILEDAEKAIVSREENGNEALVSTILNLTDGLVGNLFNVSIIVTFNTEKEKIDKALYRKGRLRAEHDFQALTIEDSQNLLDKLGKKTKAENPLTLAEIYNTDDDNYHQEPAPKPKLGFGK